MESDCDKEYYRVDKASSGKVLEGLFEIVEVPLPDSPVAKKRIQKSYRKKVESSWTHENILKLIHEVESHRCLWDIGCPEYKLHKDSVWQEIADTIPTSFNDVKGKWSNLRTTFSSNLEKLRRKITDNGTEEPIPIAWKYFKPMLFLEKNKLRLSSQSTSSVQSECESTGETVHNDSRFSDELSQPSPSPPCQQRKRKSSTPTSISGIQNNELRDLSAEAHHSLCSRNTQSKDSSTAFGEYIAAELRSLPTEQAAYVRAKLRRAFNDIMDEVTLMVPQQEKTYFYFKNK